MTPQEREERHKLAKKRASLMGQAGALHKQAEKMRASARIPYQVEQGTFGTRRGVCSVCGQELSLVSGVAIQPHTPTTCPGPAARVKMG